MNKLKEILIVLLVAVFSFPLIYAAVLFATGMLRIEYGTPKTAVEEEKKLQVIKRTQKTDSIMISNSRTFQALENEKIEIQKERERLQELQARMEITQKELDEKQNLIAGQRAKMEALVEKSDSLEIKKYKTQAKVYMSMKPLEAAQIIETFSADQAAKILGAMTDDRQKAKILAAMATDKAAAITSRIGGTR
jgi:flagellar motility protein MotE (MotC chaperone)